MIIKNRLFNYSVFTFLEMVLVFISNVKVAHGITLGGTLENQSDYSKNIGAYTLADKFAIFLSNMLGFITTIAGLYFLFYFLFGAVGWITAGGEPQKLTLAKDKMINAAIGLCVVIASYSVMLIIGQVLGFDFLDITKLLNSIS